MSDLAHRQMPTLVPLAVQRWHEIYQPSAVSKPKKSPAGCAKLKETN